MEDHIAFNAMLVTGRKKVYVKYKFLITDFEKRTTYFGKKTRI